VAFEKTKHFLDTFGEPRPPRPPILPPRWRVPFYLGLAVVSFVILVALVWFVLIPGIRAQQSDGQPLATPPSEEVKP